MNLQELQTFNLEVDSLITREERRKIRTQWNAIPIEHQPEWHKYLLNEAKKPRQ